MASGYLRQYFDVVAAKRLAKGEINKKTSNQHEYNATKECVKLFGTEDRRIKDAHFMYLSDDESVSCTGTLTWYDARRNVKDRSAEWRLYYQSNEMSERSEESDALQQY